eukprot:CAMPEP_0119409232 /NCGR_PEP_ID=MMETSP1335-20130426/2574_1 /TAXON_ID=259385 /ORGANISM="Chrysoculter rhomboideus, Strain RCC1486" /LENGTH=210 /DNA_ID=CAMNT_0007433581 /DNA_START=799 /DNA_END=1433 /DNA_ORIENTATION=-
MVLNANKPARVRLSAHTRRRLAELATERVRRTEQGDDAARVERCGAWLTAQCGTRHVELACASVACATLGSAARMAEDVVAAVADGAKARSSARTAASPERPALNDRAPLCTHARACRLGQSLSRAARVLAVDGRAEEMARLCESCGADASWATAHTPSRARRPRVDAVRGERAPARGGGAPMRAAGAEGHCADSEAQLASARVGCGGHP